MKAYLKGFANSYEQVLRYVLVKKYEKMYDGTLGNYTSNQ